MLEKSKSNETEVLISKALIDLAISHNECIFMNNALKKEDEMKEEIKNMTTLIAHQRF